MHVIKFGGTSVASAKNIGLVRDIVEKKAATENIVVVVSALGGVTNKLGDVLGGVHWGSPGKNARRVCHSRCLRSGLGVPVLPEGQQGEGAGAQGSSEHGCQHRLWAVAQYGAHQAIMSLG